MRMLGRWMTALVWKEVREEVRLYGALALILGLLDAWVYLYPGLIRGILVPFLYVPVLTFTVFLALASSFQREWREHTVYWIFSLPVPRGMLVAVKYLVHASLAGGLFFGFSVLAWILVDRYLTYLLAHGGIMIHGPEGPMMEMRAMEQYLELKSLNRFTHYLKLTGFFGAVEIFLFGVVSLYTLLPRLVSRFRGGIAFAGVVLYAYVLFRVAPYLFPSDPSWWQIALGLAGYGTLWTVGVAGLYAWRAEV